LNLISKEDQLSCIDSVNTPTSWSSVVVGHPEKLAWLLDMSRVEVCTTACGMEEMKFQIFNLLAWFNPFRIIVDKGNKTSSSKVPEKSRECLFSRLIAS